MNDTDKSPQKSEQQLYAILDGVQVGIWQCDPSHRMSFSDQVHQLLGKETLPGGLADFVAAAHPNDQKRLLAAFQDAQCTGEAFSLEVRFGTQRKGFDWFLLSGKCFGEKHLAGAILNVNDRKRFERHIRQLNNQLSIFNEELSHQNNQLTDTTTRVRLLNERLDLVVKGVNVGIWDWSEGDRWYFSGRTYELLGLVPRTSPETRNIIIEHLHPKDIPLHQEVRRQHFKLGREYQLKVRLKTASGEYRWFLINGESIRNKDGRVVRMAGSIADVHTEHEAMRGIWEIKCELESRVQLRTRALSEAEEKWRRLISSADDMILILDQEGRIDFINHTDSSLSLIRSQTLLFDYFDLPMRHLTQRKLKQAIEDPSQAVRYETYMYQPDGQRKVWFSNTLNPLLLDKQGRVKKLTLIARNITQQKQREQYLQQAYHELEKRNQQLIDKEKENKAIQHELQQTNQYLSRSKTELQDTVRQLESRNDELDNLVYKISHDIRSPLSSIMGLMDLMRQQDLNPDVRQMLGYMENRAHRLDEFIKKMLDFARASRTAAVTELVDMPSLIRDIFDDLNNHPGFERIEQYIFIDPAVVRYASDPLRLRIIFSNLISNAIKYQNPNQQQPTLNIEITQHSPVWLMIRIVDNGIGIQEEHQHRIFEMFYRATDRVEGSGLGLYIVKQTIEKLGGKIILQSQYGEGTSFTIFMPLPSTT
ncbi:MAG: ATP-binding protein [Bernardetiaceae bacterium]